MRFHVGVLCTILLAATAAGQTVRNWTSDHDQRWSRNGNWSGNNRPNTSGEIAQFGTGDQLDPELNANNQTVRGLRFSSYADAYHVGDDNGARTLRIGSSHSGFIENLSDEDQAISIATLQFQSDATIRTAGGGTLTLDSRLTGSNRDLTFDADADILVTGDIATGGGTLTKQGAANLRLSGNNSYTGATSIEAGAIVLEAAEVFANSSVVDVGAGASLRLNDLGETIGALTGNGTVDFGAGGSLALSSGYSFFAGDFSGSGTLVVREGAALILGADFHNSSLDVVLDGGSLYLWGHSFTAGQLSVTDDSIIDFGWGGADSVMEIASLAFGSGHDDLFVQNWSDASDYFFSHTGYAQGEAPLDQVTFAGWDGDDTKWLAYDHQITPVPEPSVYGALLMAAAAGLAWRRRRRHA